jgi:hypothetical protein
VALPGVKLAQPFCFLRRILGTSRENIRGEPFDRFQWVEGELP